MRVAARCHGHVIGSDVGIRCGHNCENDADNYEERSLAAVRYRGIGCCGSRVPRRNIVRVSPRDDETYEVGHAGVGEAPVGSAARCADPGIEIHTNEACSAEGVEQVLVAHGLASVAEAAL
jgi:hypothetical protein